MQLLILPYAAWMGLLSLAAPIGVVSDIPRLIATAGVLGSLTVLVYRLGVWRQEMESTKSNVEVEVRSHREESTANFARMERQLEGIEHIVTDYMEFKPQAQREHRRTRRRLERLEEQAR
jgi:hypothetical protein